MDVYSGSAIPAFRRHVIICITEIAFDGVTAFLERIWKARMLSTIWNNSKFAMMLL
jgi:hypothetical protein